MSVLENISSEVKFCTNCPLSIHRTNPVFSAGVATAPLMLIGEAPGRDEDEQGVPFVGKSGKLLDRLLQQAGFSRNTNVYIANMVKCRPPENRAPKKSEIDCCRHYLEAQIQAVNPKLIVCVGRVAAQTLINPKFKVMIDHGKIYDYNGFSISATLHPAAILRNINNISLAESDFKIFANYIESSASQKAKFL